MKDPYTILGVSPSATDEEVKNAYRELARKYHPDNYGDDNPLKDLANEKMQEVNAAYDEIQKMRQNASSGSSSGYDYSGSTGSTGIYADIRRALNARRYREAERLLESVSTFERTPEWHYLKSVVLMRQGRANDAMRELEMACEADPGNREYQQAKEMFNRGAYGSTYYNDSARRRSYTNDDICNICSNLICLDCLCECMGGDLIPCI